MEAVTADKSKILLNCELPAQLLFKSEELNDYDFVLFHLFVKNSTYREYFSRVMKEGKRMTILDNSAYEFYRDGGHFSVNDFEKIIEEFNPTYFIVPDVLMDSVSTLSNFNVWKGFLPGHKRMVVPQGKSLKEWLDCYKRMLDKGGFEYIGIPFHNDFFWDLGTTVYEFAKRDRRGPSQWNSDMAYAQGRCFLLQYLVKEALIDTSKKYHLLGSHWAEELKWLCYVNDRSHEYDWIASMDTSFPVTKGIMKCQLTEGEKETISIDEFFEKPLDEYQFAKVIENIKKFHGYKKGY